MKKSMVLGLVLCVTGCESMNHTEKGLLGGGLVGTGLGAVIGGLAGDPAAGAAIGAVTGLAAGGIAGAITDDAVDRADARARAEAHAQQNPPVAMHDVIRMAQQHFSDAVIIDHIRATNSTYTLTVADMEWLASQGVSQNVIREMVNRRPQLARPCPPPVYIAEPCPPPVSVGFGFGYGPRCGPGWRRCH
jgi:hypothetical protein